MIHLINDKVKENPQADFLDRKTIMERFGISVSTLQRWMHQKGLKYYKVDRRVFFKADDFYSWLEKNRMES